MRQAVAAAQALRVETDGDLARALETALTVCFMRPFTNADMSVPERFVPQAETDRTLFGEVKAFRDKVYAHTDKESGRKTGPMTVSGSGEVVQVNYQEAWGALDRDTLPLFIGLCERVAEQMRIGAVKIHQMLNGELPVEYW